LAKLILILITLVLLLGVYPLLWLTLRTARDARDAAVRTTDMVARVSHDMWMDSVIHVARVASAERAASIIKKRVDPEAKAHLKARVPDYELYLEDVHSRTLPTNGVKG